MHQSLTAVAGYLLAFAAVAAGLGSVAWPVLILPAGLAAWAAVGLAWRHASRRSLLQALLLVLVGLGGLAWGMAEGVRPDIHRALSANMGLIGLLIAVSFLQLVALPAKDASGEQPRGRGTFRATGLGVHLFGAVINLSAVFLVAERLRRQGPLGREQAVLLTRFFAAAGFWSPFFAAMAAALAFAPDARLLHLMTAGLPLAALGMLISYVGTGRKVGDDFVGYPPHYRHLRVPAVLASAVLLIHVWNDSLSVIAVITLLSPVITVAGLMMQRGRSLGMMRSHVSRNLPRMVNELLLFLAAGVLAAGIGSALAAMGDWSPYGSFGAREAWLTTVFITAFAVVGVHPVIGIATFGTMVAPLEPHNSLLAMSFLAAWGLGAAASPLSGMNLGLQGRFGLDGFSIMRWNAGYTMLMLLATAPLFWLAAELLCA